MPVKQDPASDLAQGAGLLAALETACADLKAAWNRQSVSSAQTAAKLAKAKIDAILAALVERAAATKPKAATKKNIATGIPSKRARRAKRVSETGHTDFWRFWSRTFSIENELARCTVVSRSEDARRDAWRSDAQRVHSRPNRDRDRVLRQRRQPERLVAVIELV